MSSIEEQVVMVMSIIPDFGQDMVRKALSQSKGNVEVAIDLLLTGQIQSTQNSTFDEDMLLAQKLQNELNLDQNSSYNEDELLAQQLSAEDPDEIYAKFLQQQINQQSVGNYGVVPTYNTNFDINSIDSNVVNEMVNQVKGEIIPMITNELQNVKIPDINEEIEAGKVGKVAFGVKGVAMSQVIVPSDKLKITLNGAQISIEIADISASMQEFEWYYRKESFPKLKDDGKGNAGVSSCKIMANLMFGMGPTGPSLTVTSSSVTIEKLDLKISGTAASFFYNFIISAFKSTIKSNMEKTLSDMVRDTMNEGTQGFLSVFD